MEYNIDEHQVRVMYANMDILHEIETKIRMKLAAVETNLHESSNLGSYFHNMVCKVVNPGLVKGLLYKYKSVFTSTYI